MNESTASYWTDAEINTHIVNAYHQVMQMTQAVKSASGTILSGAQTFNVPADWGGTVAFFVNNRPVAFTDARSLGTTGVIFTDATAANNDSGQPIAYFVSGIDASNNPAWTLYPIADKDYGYKLYYVPVDSGLAADSSIPLFRNDWHWILGLYATAMCWMKGNRKPSLGAMFMQMWEDAKRDAEFYLVDFRAQNVVTRFVDGRTPIARNAQTDPLEIPGI